MCRKMKRRKWNERYLKLKSSINDVKTIKKIKMKRHIFSNLVETKKSFFSNKIKRRRSFKKQSVRGRVNGVLVFQSDQRGVLMVSVGS